MTAQANEFLLIYHGLGIFGGLFLSVDVQYIIATEIIVSLAYSVGFE